MFAKLEANYQYQPGGSLFPDAPTYPSSVTKRQKKIRIHSHLLSKRRDLGKNSLTLLIEPSL